MQQIIAGVLAAMLAFSPAQAAIPQQKEENITVLGELAKLDNKNWLSMSNEQMLEDFDYLYKVLDENYPYFEVGKRMSGTGLRDTYAATRNKLKSCTSDIDFFILLDTWLRKDGAQAGHLGVLLPGSMEAMAKVYRTMSDTPDDPYVLAYSDPNAVSSYEKFGKLFTPVFDRVMAYYAEGTTGEQEAPPNVETKIIETGKTAYVKIRSFDMMSFETDKQILLAFYKQVGEYENLIIDLSENGGGGMAYFDELILEPNIDGPVHWSFYSLFKDGPMNRKFIGTEQLIEEDYCEKAMDFPTLAPFNRVDLQDVDYFCRTDMTNEPPAGQKKLFQGKIWMLVSGNVYSSSEWAAMVSKSTGFATLVGTQTGGDGIGTDPVPVVLPNSGLIVRYSPIYGVTQQGYGSEEYGTTPDILSDEGETPLETCLKAIAGNS